MFLKFKITLITYILHLVIIFLYFDILQRNNRCIIFFIDLIRPRKGRGSFSLIRLVTLRLLFGYAQKLGIITCIQSIQFLISNIPFIKFAT